MLTPDPSDPCIRCGARPATDSGWPHCEDCYQTMCNEVHEAVCEDREREDAARRRVPDLLLRVMRGRVGALRLEDGHWRGACPWCDGDGELCESLFVYPAANIYHCFACGQRGDAIQFIMRHEDLRFTQAVELLAKEFGL